MNKMNKFCVVALVSLFSLCFVSISNVKAEYTPPDNGNPDNSQGAGGR